MITAYLVTRKEKHIDDKNLIFLQREDAMDVANSLITYWESKYPKGEAYKYSLDTILHYEKEDGFSVEVTTIQIHEAGETANVGR